MELSLEAQDLLARIFRPDPKQRISLAAMRRHPWPQHTGHWAPGAGFHLVSGGLEDVYFSTLDASRRAA